MKNKKVCIFTAVHGVFDTRIFHREAKTVAKAGYEVVFLVQHDKEEIVDNIRIVPLSRPKNRFERMTKEVWRLFRLGLKEKADVYHFHDPELIPVGLILKLFRKKVIYDVHENVSMQMQSKDWIPAFLRTVVGLFAKFIERLSLPFFDRAVIAGEDIGLQPHFRKYHHKIILIRNFPVISVPGPVALNNNNGKVRFIYTGELAVDKGIHEIVRASKSLTAENFELTLLGNFSFPDFEGKILKEISGEKRIKYMPFVPYRKMFDLLVKNHVGLICFKPTPNNINALSGRNNKIYEYIEAGLAVIGSNFESWGDFMHGNKIGIAVDPSNITEIKRAMEFFIKNPQKMRIMQENAKKLSIKYSWKAESRKLIGLYEGLLK